MPRWWTAMCSAFADPKPIEEQMMKVSREKRVVSFVPQWYGGVNRKRVYTVSVGNDSTQTGDMGEVVVRRLKEWVV